MKLLARSQPRLMPIRFRFLIIGTIVAPPLGENEFWRLIQVLDLVVKLFVLTKRGFIVQRDHLSTRAPKEEAMAMKKTVRW
jgi:hypothetical protein